MDCAECADGLCRQSNLFNQNNLFNPHTPYTPQFPYHHILKGLYSSISNICLLSL